MPAKSISALTLKRWTYIMKRIISSAMSLAVMLTAFALPTFAAANEGSNSKSVTATIAGISSEKPVLDGKIGKYEYEEIKFTADDLRVSGTSDERLKKNVTASESMKLYASYSKDTVYVAVVIDTPEYVQTMTATDMWQQHSLQIGAAKGDEKTAANRTEMGFARRSDDDTLMYVLWTDAYKTEWNANTQGKDFVCVTENGVTTYEIALPAEVFGVDTLDKGDTIRLNFCMNVATSSADRGAVEWSQGTATAKDATLHALVTLGDAIVAPAATTTAAQTADTVSLTIAAAASAVALAFVAKKKR